MDEAPAPAGPSELMPLLIAMDFMIQDGQPDGKGLAIRPADYPKLSPEDFDGMVEKLQKVAKVVRLLEKHRPCVFRALKLWARVA